MPFLAQVREAKMRAFVVPGQRLEAEARLLHDGSGYAVVEGSLSSGGKKVAEAEIRYRVVPFPNVTLRARMLDSARRIGVAEEHLHAA
jgi:3-hydroxyacyl-[acyl-carrier-protein] dehydratase